MSVTGVFSKGRPTGHPAAVSVLKYIPRPRVPWQPSRFARANLDPADLKKLWGQGRYRTGYGNYNSGYSTEKTHTLEDNTISIIPKQELAKYMPDIHIGGKALVTPVSLMSARAGHRVTHDLLHSYDPFVGQLRGHAKVDHENITYEDPNHVGLNPTTLDSRGRIYRWLRRGPFFQEDHYFRRSTALERDGSGVPVSPHEGPLMARIIRLARRGHLKAACETYRRVTSVPPVEVYRALTAACIPAAQLADAVAIFEDGNARLFYVARDGEVLHNLMRCAIRAKHRVRIMWVYNVMRGRFYENNLVRAEIDPIWQYRIAALALEYLLDHHAAEEARAVYTYMVETDLIDCDVAIRVGQLMQEALKEGKTIQMNAETFQGTALVRNAELVAPQVARTVYQRYQHALREACTTRGDEDDSAAISAAWCAETPMTDPAEAADAMQWLQRSFPDVAVAAVLRLARFQRGRKDLMARDRPAYLQRVGAWLELLSTAHQGQEEGPLPYLHKSRPSLTSANVRVAWLPERCNGQSHHSLRLTSARQQTSEAAYTFHYTPDVRLVAETFAHAGDTLQSRYLAQVPHHTEVHTAVSLHRVVAGNTTSSVPLLMASRSNTAAAAMLQAPAAAEVLHESVTAGLQTGERRAEPGTAGSLVQPEVGSGSGKASGETLTQGAPSDAQLF